MEWVWVGVDGGFGQPKGLGYLEDGNRLEGSSSQRKLGSILILPFTGGDTAKGKVKMDDQPFGC
ncbi:hypothetical protein [Pseudoxanthomonas sp. CF125]|uniref:hypothetical protein n=1 Tax=Pseudoxanthomonas sp. CF125 TaxID=1855303 RepID=UPI000B896D8F|nr:hypothetical protein [Pseudoxanthomonas sp. CF125]